MSSCLKHLMILEAAKATAAPMAGRLLADWGADVIRIEHPVSGKITESNLALRKDGRAIASDIDFRAENIYRNKRGMTLDLAQEEGQEVMYRLLRGADVLITGFRPRELKKFKLEYSTLREIYPGLIYANMTGYGREGPDKDLPGYEHTSYFPRTGILHVLQTPGAPPAQVPIGVGDNVAGLALALGIMTALYQRERTGTGQEVDVCLYHTGIFALSRDIDGALITGKDRQAIERKDVANPLLNCYQTKDGRWLRMGLAEPDIYWQKFCRAIGRPELEHDIRFSSTEAKVANHAALFNIVEEVFASKTLAEWKVRLNKEALPWGPVQNLPEVIHDPQARLNNFFVSYQHPVHGQLEVVANPVKLSECSESVRMPAPLFNEHTDEILLQCGYTQQDIQSLKGKKVIAE